MTSEEFDEVVFPGTVCDADTVEVRIPMMGLRDYFAGQALTGILSWPREEEGEPEAQAFCAYQVGKARR